MLLPRRPRRLGEAKEDSQRKLVPVSLPLTHVQRPCRVTSRLALRNASPSTKKAVTSAPRSTADVWQYPAEDASPPPTAPCAAAEAASSEALGQRLADVTRKKRETEDGCPRCADLSVHDGRNAHELSLPLGRVLVRRQGSRLVWCVG